MNELDKYISSMAADPIGPDGQLRHLDPDAVNAAQKIDMANEEWESRKRGEIESAPVVMVPKMSAENISKCYGISVEQAKNEGYK